MEMILKVLKKIGLKIIKKHSEKITNTNQNFISKLMISNINVVKKVAKGDIMVVIPCFSEDKSLNRAIDAIEGADISAGSFRGNTKHIGIPRNTACIFSDFFYGFPDRKDALEILVREKKNTDFNYCCLVQAIIPKGFEYLRFDYDGKTTFAAADIEISNKKIEFFNNNEKNDVEVSYTDEDKEVYMLSRFIEFDDEKGFRHVGGNYYPFIEPKHSAISCQKLSIERLKKKLVEHLEWEQDDYWFLVFPTLEKAKEEADIRMGEVAVKCMIPQGKPYIEFKPGCIACLDVYVTPTAFPVTKNKQAKEEVTEEEIAKEREMYASRFSKLEDKKSQTEYVAYNKHSQLNPPYLTATSSITCIDSYQMHEIKKQKEENEEEGYRYLLVEISDCRDKIRLHNQGGDLEDFKKKIETLIDNLQDFLDHLYVHPTPADVVDTAKKKFPERYK